MLLDSQKAPPEPSLLCRGGKLQIVHKYRDKDFHPIWPSTHTVTSWAKEYDSFVWEFRLIVLYSSQDVNKLSAVFGKISAALRFSSYGWCLQRINMTRKAALLAWICKTARLIILLLCKNKMCSSGLVSPLNMRLQCMSLEAETVSRFYLCAQY